jgi:mono/diheme cytochrome c family protein
MAIYVILAITPALVLVPILWIFSGRYDASATHPHMPIVRQLIHEATERSIRFHAGGIVAPRFPDDSVAVAAGFGEYREMCESCHSAPGIADTEIRRGLYPRPPVFHKRESEWNAAQLFWITKNGLKSTGMPAFGPTHSDDELWRMVAFVMALPKVTAEQYAALARAEGNKAAHGEETAGHDDAEHEHHE